MQHGWEPEQMHVTFFICKGGAKSQVGKLWLRLEGITVGVKKWDRRLWTELI